MTDDNTASPALPLAPDPMPPDPQPDNAQPDSAAAAFMALASEVALLRRATEGLSAEKARLEMPDYSPTLGNMDARLARIDRSLHELAQKPALQLTPQGIAEQINKAAEQSRRSDAATISEAREAHSRAAHDIKQLVGAIRAKDDQRKRLYQFAGGGLAAGCLLWSFLPGTLARALPDSWQLPEKMAAHIVGEPTPWEAATHMMKAQNPAAFAALNDAMTIHVANRAAIEACQKEAHTQGQAVKCTVRVSESGG